MDWIKLIMFAATLRFALPLCAVLLLAPSGLTALPVLDDEGVLTIGDGETLIHITLGIDGTADLTLEELIEDHDLGLMAIIIEKEGILELLPGTMVHLGGSYVSVKGTLIVPSTLGTGIYSGEEWDGIDLSELKPDKPTNFYIDGGTIQIIEGDHDVLWADTIKVTLGSGGGTIDVAEDIIFESGSISGGQTGNVTKLGEGMYRVDDVSMGGNFDVKEGIVHFLGNATVGKLNSEAGTIISGLHDHEDDHESHNHNHGTNGTSNADVSIVKGGEIKGTLEDIGYLHLGDGTSAATLVFDTFGIEHTIEKIGIARNATLDLKDGTLIQLTSEDAHRSYDDLIIEGKLRVSSAEGTGIYKGNDVSSPEETYLTVAGSTNSVGEVIGGIVEIYKSDSDGDTPETLIADTLHTKVVGIGKMIVENGVTFESGTIMWGAAATQTNVTGAHVIVSGGGTYKAAEVDLGTGYFVVEEGTTVEFLKTVTAGALIGEKDTQVIANGKAIFGAVNFAGDYEGNNSDLTIQSGGRITGHVKNIQELTLGGDLLLAVDKTATPTISAGTWTLSDPETTRIRTTAGTVSDIYQKVIQIQDAGSRADLLAVLQASETALYRPTWLVNSHDNTYLDLQLSILSVNDYISNVWRRRGKNIDNIGQFIENISMQYPTFREYLESLNDTQLRDTLRSAMAGELAGNAFRFAMLQPSQTVFRHLDDVAPLRSPFTNSRGQVREGFNVWFNPFGQAEHAKGETDTFDGYNLARYGFHLGGDIEIYSHAVAGVLFGYTAPDVKSDLGKISANDYTAGLYFRTPTVWDIVTNMMIGFGSQDYVYKNGFGNSKFRGNSLFASVELSRPLPLPICRLTPLIAMDFQSATMDSFIVADPVLGGVAIEPEDLSQAMVRVGLLGNFWRVRTRMQYIRQIAGEDFVSSQTTLVGDLSAATQVRGTQWGKDWLNIGIGGELLATRHWRIFADYNFDMGKQTTAHLGSLNTILRW